MTMRETYNRQLWKKTARNGPNETFRVREDFKRRRMGKKKKPTKRASAPQKSTWKKENISRGYQQRFQFRKKNWEKGVKLTLQLFSELFYYAKRKSPDKGERSWERRGN